MNLVARHDRAGVALRSPYFDAAGALHIEGTLARTGVMNYPQPDGTVHRELVRSQELFEPASMAALIGLPVTDGAEQVEHVFGTGPATMLRPEEVAPVRRGSVVNAWRSGEYLAVETVITDPALQKKILERKQVELSPGYLCPLVERAGVEGGEHFDAVQGRRFYRGEGDGWFGHVAVVPLGRCTSATHRCALHLDSAGACGCSSPPTTISSSAPAAEGAAMKITLQGLCAKAYPTDTNAAFAAYASVKLRARRDAAGPEAAAQTEKSMSALQALCIRAYPDDAAGALKAYSDVMEEMKAADDDEDAPADTIPVTSVVPTMNAAGVVQQRVPAVRDSSAEIAALKKLTDQQAARIDALTEAVKQPRHDAMTDERLALIYEVSQICGGQYVYAGKTPTQMRMDALAVICPAKVEALKGKSETYLAEYYAVQRDTSPHLAAAKENVIGVPRMDGAGMPGIDPELAELIAVENRLNGIAH